MLVMGLEIEEGLALFDPSAAIAFLREFYSDGNLEYLDRLDKINKIYTHELEAKIIYIDDGTWGKRVVYKGSDVVKEIYAAMVLLQRK